VGHSCCPPLCAAKLVVLAGIAGRMARRASARPREGKRVGSAVWFDVTLGLPLGLKLGDAAAGNRVVVEEVREGGSAFTHNAQHTLYEADHVGNRQQWIQEGDQLLMVNGEVCNSMEAAVELITGAPDPQSVRFKFARGPYIKVIFPEDGAETTIRAEAAISEAAERAGHKVAYKCADGTCGSCWRKDYDADEVYVLCLDDCKVGKIPSKAVFNDEVNIFWSEKQYRERNDKKNNPNFDNTEPLVLRSCPEVYQLWREQNPLEATVSDATVSRFGGVFKGLAGDKEIPESKPTKWGGGKSWEGLDLDGI